MKYQTNRQERIRNLCEEIFDTWGQVTTNFLIALLKAEVRSPQDSEVNSILWEMEQEGLITRFDQRHPERDEIMAGYKLAGWNRS